MFEYFYGFSPEWAQAPNVGTRVSSKNYSKEEEKKNKKKAEHRERSNIIMTEVNSIFKSIAMLSRYGRSLVAHYLLMIW